MDLTSPLFLFLFLPIFLLIYWTSNHYIRQSLVLIASIIFLIAGQLVALYWLSSLLFAGYIFGHIIQRAQTNGVKGKIFLWVGIGINIAILIFFKLSIVFGINGTAWIHRTDNWFASIIGLAVPLGLSYAAFQLISYLVDVYRGKITAEINFLRLAIYVLFFPKLISGPLIRYQSFSEQFDSLAPSIDNMATGLRRLMAGFIKRILISNQLAVLVDSVFNLPTPNIEPGIAWLVLIAYALQIYFDFSGYTDVAIGLALMIGIRLPENFDYPYIAQSISDFWRRWHMTLIKWFREYVFYPLERNRVRWAGQQLNIIFVFLLTGLWHGFKPTFVMWGLLHGVAIAFESTKGSHWLKNTWRPLRHFYTLFIILIGWVFFRSENMDFAFGFLRRMFGDKSGITPLPFSQTTPLPFIEPSFILVLVISIICSLPLSPIWQRLRTLWEQRNPWLFFVFQPGEDILIIMLFILGLAALLSGTFKPNIYANF
jgi:alginate O-acetyltransferase complex protein AlgI